MISSLNIKIYLYHPILNVVLNYDLNCLIFNFLLYAGVVGQKLTLLF